MHDCFRERRPRPTAGHEGRAPPAARACARGNRAHGDRSAGRTAARARPATRRVRAAGTGAGLSGVRRDRRASGSRASRRARAGDRSLAARHHPRLAAAGKSPGGGSQAAASTRRAGHERTPLARDARRHAGDGRALRRPRRDRGHRQLGRRPRGSRRPAAGAGAALSDHPAGRRCARRDRRASPDDSRDDRSRAPRQGPSDGAARLAPRHRAPSERHPDDSSVAARACPRSGSLCRSSTSAPRVCFRGDGDPAPDLAGAQIFLSTSRAEGFSRAVLEALAAGVPVVSTEVGGIAELRGDAVRVAAVGDDAALAAHVLAWLQDPAALVAAADAARRSPGGLRRRCVTPPTRACTPRCCAACNPDEVTS